MAFDRSEVVRRVKPHYLYDVAIQHYVLSACGVDISSACLMHLNRDYRYDGDAHDLQALFTIRDRRGTEEAGCRSAQTSDGQRKALAQQPRLTSCQVLTAQTHISVTFSANAILNRPNTTSHSAKARIEKTAAAHGARH